MAFSIYNYKIRFQNKLRPLVNYLYSVGITANLVTVIALFGSLLVSLLLIFCHSERLFIVIPFWMLIRMALNAMDGMLAREFHQKSNLGAYLNELSDVVADCLLYLCFMVIPDISLLALLMIIILAIISEYSGVLALMVGASRRYDGPMGKSDRAFIFGLIALLCAFQWPTIVWVNAILYLTVVLLCLTIANRIRAGLKESTQLINRKDNNAK